jgi:transposase-like protein
MSLSNTRDDKHMHNGDFAKLYEIKLDALMRPHGPFGWMVDGSDKLTAIPGQRPDNTSHLQEKLSAGEMSCYGPLAVDGPFKVDKREQYGSKRTETQIYNKLEMEACPNQKCALYGKTGKGNILFNGTYPTKEGIQGRRFLCKECGESFCGRAGTIFHNLRSPEQRILKALKFLAKGMTLRGVAKVLGVKRDTVRHWLKVAAERSEKIDTMLMGETDVSQIELDELWASVKRNSLPQRATLWKGRGSINC